MHINIKNLVNNHSDDLIKPEQIETKNLLMVKNTEKKEFDA